MSRRRVDPAAAVASSFKRGTVGTNPGPDRGARRHMQQPQDNSDDLDEDDDAKEERRLRKLVVRQQQHIELLEQKHLQDLRLLRKAWGEAKSAQRQRFEEVDKALRLEELVSQMQTRVFCGGSAKTLAQYEDWLTRSKEALEAD